MSDDYHDPVVALASAAAARIAALVEQVNRVTAERDYAIAVADSLRFHNERLESELATAIRELVNVLAALDANR